MKNKLKIEIAGLERDLEKLDIIYDLIGVIENKHLFRHVELVKTMERTRALLFDVKTSLENLLEK